MIYFETKELIPRFEGKDLNVYFKDKVIYEKSTEKKYVSNVLQHYDKNHIGDIAGKIEDIAPNGTNDGTLLNVQLSSDGRYLEANGVDSRIDFVGEITPRYTIMGVFMLIPVDDNQLHPRVVDGAGGNNRYPGIYARKQAAGGTRDHAICVYGHGKDTAITPITLFPLNQLFHLAYRYNGTSVDVFINGNYVGKIDTTVDAPGWSLTSLFGSSFTANRYLKGGACNFMRYGRALNDEEIRNNYEIDYDEFINLPEPEPEPLPEYANIGGIMVKRENEAVMPGGRESNGNIYYTFSDAQTLFAPILLSPADWDVIRALGTTWDDEKKGRWIGTDHALKKETEFSTFLPALGRIESGTTVYNTDVGYYWSTGMSDAARGNHIMSTRFGSLPLAGQYTHFGSSVRCKKPEPLPEYANINGIMLKRENEVNRPTIESDDQSYYNRSAAISIGQNKYLPTSADWATMLAVGSTWDDEKEGRWIGADHALKKETEFSTFLPALGFIHRNETVVTDFGTVGNYWSSSSSSGNYWALSFRPTFVIPSMNAGHTEVRLSVRLKAE